MSGNVSRFRVRSYELDSFGHANHAIFLNWFEQARIDAVEAGGLRFAALVERGWSVVVARIEVEYRSEARLGDRVAVHTELEEVGRSSMTFVQEAMREPERPDQDATLLARARVVVVWLEGGRPTRVSDEIRRALEGG